MELRPGYKLTEIGPLPVDWETERLLAVADCLDSLRVPLNEAQRQKMQGDIPYCGANGVLDFVNDFVVDDDIILMAEDGGYFDEYASRPIAYRMSGKSWVNNHAHILKAKAGADQAFLFYSLVHKNILPFLASGTRAKLNKSEMAKILVPSPSSKSEQSAIATALSDVDALLAAQDALVAKKRAIKQGAMQELLTCKRRLPGFGGEWEVKRLGDIAPLQRGFDLPTSTLQQGDYPVVYSNGILNHHAGYQVEGPGVVTGRSGTIGSVTFVEGRYWPHNTSLWVTNFKGNNPRFVFYLYICIGLERFATGSGVPTLNRNDVHAHTVALPSSAKEQAAITAALDDMDAEITALETQRAKTAQLKQGMMQALLTGRIRLI